MNAELLNDNRPLAYIVGPYSSIDMFKTQATPLETDMNIASARRVGLQVARKGYGVLIPHSNSSQFDRIAPDIDYRFWMSTSLATIRRLDVNKDIVVCCPGWEDSPGTREEIELAMNRQLTVYYTTNDVPDLYKE